MGSVGGGEHYLQITIPMWHGSRESGDSLRKKWSGRGLLWTKAVTLSPIKFVVEPKRVVADCKWVVFYERGLSRNKFSQVGDQELFLRPPALNVPVSALPLMSR